MNDKKLVFVFPTNRHQLSLEVEKGISPDNALYGANYLERAGYKVIINDIPTWLEKLLDTLFSPVHKLFHSQIDIDFKVPRAVLQLFSLNQADVIITATDGIGMAVCLLKRLKLVTPPIIYSVGLFYIQGKMKDDIESRKNTIFRSFYRWTLSAATHIIFHAPTEKQKLIKLQLYNPATCTFVPMGSDANFFKKDSKKTISKLILSVGKDRARDYQTLFEAAKILPDLDFIAICRRNNISGLKKPENLQVFFDIPYKEVLGYYQKASVIVIPMREMSRSSGQMTLTDSMLLQKPTIVSDVEGISHYPLKSNINVIKITPGKPLELSQAIRKVLSDSHLRKTLEKNSKIFAQSFNTQNYSKDIENVIELVLDPTKLKPVSSEDLEFLRKIRNQNRNFFLNNQHITKENQKKWFQKYKDRKDDYMFILMKNKTRVGTGAIYNINQEKQTAEIGRFIIGSAFRGKGYGRILLSKIEFVARQLNLESVNLEVFKSNLQAIRLYKNSGFTLYDHHKSKKTIEMSKNLRHPKLAQMSPLY